MGQLIDIPITANGAIKADIKDSIASGKIYVGDSSNTSSEVSISGDATLNNTGVLTIATGAIDNAKLSAPKLTAYQETFAFGDMTDGGGTSGTFDLTTTVPEGAVFVQSFIDSVTGFTGDTSATITIGDGSDVDRYNTGTPDVFTTADHISAGSPSGTTYHSADKTPTITVTSGSSFASVAAGSLTVTLLWYQSV